MNDPKTTPDAPAFIEATEIAGLSLRDRAALAALTGCLAAGRQIDKAALVADAYALADEFVAASLKDPK